MRKSSAAWPTDEAYERSPPPWAARGAWCVRSATASPDPLWMSQLEWPVIIHELGLGFPMKFIWEGVS